MSSAERPRRDAADCCGCGGGGRMGNDGGGKLPCRSSSVLIDAPSSLSTELPADDGATQAAFASSSLMRFLSSSMYSNVPCRCMLARPRL